ncbi:hypothetical protein G4B88_002307 [Cannabis sativa]|uniref:Reverse transcriptase zinc-binding domain-containing protein n=1 Tax=Cannabis sativa TaxID=3483 RepID=A0A7J6EUV7_CANSA|nr:hypothetical protein G4B88_002307 [Cannabis sativa]
MATIENEQVEKGQKQGSMQVIGVANSEWMTPKRKGMKIANVVETKAIENFKNGYEVLQETIDGNLDPPISITFNGDAIFKWDNVSDHSFCLIWNQKKSNVGFKPFRFCNFWADHSNYKQRVLEAWETPTDRRGLEGIMQKLHRVRQSLIRFRGKFHAKLFYNLQVEAQEVKYSRAIWNKLIIPKHRFILWQACNVQLLTRDHLSKFLIIPSTLCPVCENDIETHTHLFFDCVFARKTFVEIGEWLGVVDWPKEAEKIQQWCTRGPLDFKNRVINSVFAASLYLLWKNRNSCIFDLVCSSPLKLSMEIRKLSHYRILSLTCNTSKKQDKYIIDVIRGW